MLVSQKLYEKRGSVTMRNYVETFHTNIDPFSTCSRQIFWKIFNDLKRTGFVVQSCYLYAKLDCRSNWIKKSYIQLDLSIILEKRVWIAGENCCVIRYLSDQCIIVALVVSVSSIYLRVDENKSA